jgi:phage baseplate assembly protein W
MPTLNRFIGIRFPFKNSEEGFYFDLTKTAKDAVKSNLTHLLLTKKGSRLYKPDFGTNIQDFIFEPMDDQTFDLLKNEIVSAIQNNIQGINIDLIELTTENHVANLNVKYSYNDGVFVVKDILNLTFS